MNYQEELKEEKKKEKPKKEKKLTDVEQLMLNMFD
jgi:hypothetical protein